MAIKSSASSPESDESKNSDQMNTTNSKQLTIRDHDHTKLVRLKLSDNQTTEEQLNQVNSYVKTSTMIAQLISEKPAEQKEAPSGATQSCNMPIKSCINFATLIYVIYSTLNLAQICQCDNTIIAQKRQLSSPISIPKSHHNEQLRLSSISDIERQHFKLTSPSKPFEQGYESRFTSTSTNSFSPQYYASQSSPPTSNKKADDSMRDIMRMHEQLASGASSVAVHSSSANRVYETHHQVDPQQQVLNQHMMLLAPPIKSQTVSSTNNYMNNGASNDNSQQALNWRELVKSPAKMASTLINPNKLMSQVFSYVSPLVGSNLKLPIGSSLINEMSHVGVLSSGISRARALNSFYGRSSKPSKLETSAPNQRPSTIAENMFLTKPSASETRGDSLVMATQPTPTLMSGFTGDSSYSLAKMAYQTAKKKLLTQQPSSKDHLQQSSSKSDLNSDSSTTLNAAIAAATAKNPLGTTGYIQPEVSPPDGPNSIEEKGMPKAKDQSAPTRASSWIKKHTNNYLQDSLRDLILLSQLPILSGPISTAPSVLERGGKFYGLKKGSYNVTSENLGSGLGSGGSNLGPLFQDPTQRLKAIDEVLRLAYILTTGVRRKRDPLKAISTNSNPLSLANNMATMFSQRSLKQLMAPNNGASKGDRNGSGLTTYAGNANKRLRSIILAGLPKSAKPRGVVWDMATDPSLAVTVFHLIERASVALPLGFLLMPIVQMIRNPLNGINLGRILPPRASHRSVELEELAKRLDSLDKMLSRALRPTHREAFVGK